MMLSERDELLLNAYLDGELGPGEAASFKLRLDKEPGLAAALEKAPVPRAERTRPG